MKLDSRNDVHDNNIIFLMGRIICLKEVWGVMFELHVRHHN